MREYRHDQHLQRYVERSVGPGVLATRIVTVMQRLPKSISMAFISDPCFRLALDDYVPGEGRTVWMACPQPGNGSRCVILKPKLAHCREDFAHYVIAHELAHAHLRNGGWGHHLDPESAADALADSWGFARPAESIITQAPIRKPA